MEPAKIDWKRIDSRFVEDVFYEYIRAPKWYDFLASEDESYADDETWFCRPDCNHPKTAEDFLKTPSPSKLSSTGDASEILPLDDLNHRRGQTTTHLASNETNAENQNPKLSTPPNLQAKSWKALFKSSSVQKKNTDQKLQNEECPRLKSTLSARNLFAGNDIFSHLTEFCNELKKLTTRAKDQENDPKLNDQMCQMNEHASSDVLVERQTEEKERMPLLEVAKEKCQELDKGSSNKEKPRRKKRINNAENIPISINLENIKHKDEDRLLQVRINPPSPQCFSITRAPTNTTPSKSLKSNQKERGILQEVKLKNEVKAKEQSSEKSQKTPSSILDAKEQKGLDVFWFLKPCTMDL